MKKVIQWFVLIVMIVLAFVYGLEWLMRKPYWSEIATGVAVGLTCTALFAGIAIGAVWTFLVSRGTAREMRPGYVVSEQTEGARWRALRDGIRMLGSGQGQPESAPPAQQQNQPWLPPLQPFDAEFEEIERED